MVRTPERKDTQMTVGHGAEINRLRGNALEALRSAARLEVRAEERDSGYANHETFLAAMQLAGNMTPGGSDELERVRARVRDRLDLCAKTGCDAGETRAQLATELHLYLEQLRDARAGGPWAQELATAALGRVDWHELAAEQLDYVREQEGEDG
jgi:hypothetical protein